MEALAVILLRPFGAFHIINVFFNNSLSKLKENLDVPG